MTLIKAWQSCWNPVWQALFREIFARCWPNSLCCCRRSADTLMTAFKPVWQAYFRKKQGTKRLSAGAGGEQVYWPGRGRAGAWSAVHWWGAHAGHWVLHLPQQGPGEQPGTHCHLCYQQRHLSGEQNPKPSVFNQQRLLPFDFDPKPWTGPWSPAWHPLSSLLPTEASARWA